MAFRPEAGDGFPHSGREVRKLAGALRSPTFTIEKPYLAISRQAAEIDLMRTVKRALDPKSILNPGKIFDVA